MEGSTTELTAAFRGCRSEAVDDRAPVHYSSSPRAVVSSAWTGTPACRPAPLGRGPAYVGLAVRGRGSAGDYAEAESCARRRLPAASVATRICAVALDRVGFTQRPATRARRGRAPRPAR